MKPFPQPIYVPGWVGGVFDELLPLLATVSLTDIALAMAVCFGAAALSGMSGFGAGLLIALFITPVIGAQAVVPVLSVVMTITNLSRIWFFRAKLSWRLVLLIGGPGAIAAMFGALLYVRLEATSIQAILGAVLMASIPLRRYLAGREISPSAPVLVGFGGVFGFFTSIMVGVGMLVVPMLLGAGLTGGALLATDAAIAVTVNIIKIWMFGGLDSLTLELAIIALVMGLCTVPGTWLAAWIIKYTDLRIHTLAVEVLVVLGGAALLLGSVFG